ncbi:MAG: NAD(P)H-binding protein [Alphaproteobacteria bacterium]|nr:NAD(P)H-binding protein [Alphaproteobacteria bacterium]
MTKPKILVTGAGGRTGAATVLQLLEKGFPVRAFVRRKGSGAAALEGAGAEIFVGDLFDFRDLREAMIGVQRAYHCPPFAPNLLHNTMLFAIAAEEARLEVVALMSQWNASASHPSVVSREHWIANQIYRWMPSVDVVHINPGLFAFTYLLGLPAIAHFGMFMAPFGEGLNAPPANEDIARVVTGVLADPRPHIGKSYRPTGPKLVAPQDVAGILATVLDRKVAYRDVPTKMFVKAAMAQGFPLSDIAHVRHYAAELRNGAFALGAPTDHVEEVTGTAPEDLESTVRRYVRDPALIYPGLGTGSKLQALGLLLKVMSTRPAKLDAWERDRGYPLLGNPELAVDNPAWRAAAERQQLDLLSNDLPHKQVA